MANGKYIWLDGPDGVGKTTICRELAKKIKPSITVAFPSRATAPGKLIREVFEGKQQVDLRAMMWLFIADGVDMEPRIAQWLAEGTTVVADRHTFVSSQVYQTEIHSKNDVLQAQYIAGFRMPDRAYFLDLDPREALARLTARGEAINPLYESVDLDKLDMMRVKYLRVAQGMGARARIVMAHKVEEVTQFILDDLHTMA